MAVELLFQAGQLGLSPSHASSRLLGLELPRALREHAQRGLVFVDAGVGFLRGGGVFFVQLLGHGRAERAGAEHFGLTKGELGLGVGILAKMAFDPKRDRTLRAIDASHLFESSTTRLGIKRGAYLRRYAYEFIELFAPQLPRTVVERAVRGEEGSRYEL